ncbi:F0F1 ATP synthase subunit B [Candidatus Chrysopegis kryptomonas]|jgi:F-type H+-transporting ATPase subunit b|uniref:ATP synthase subunit b n=1 Tax=Candidatus Chryseopegocella kryptomonas TaxID=1633643 RepID=A0A0P1NYS4_9BACT|nr:F0F1 ATP synthase subunit B [Candidatus Chrysopegis kryptomonas]CUT03778.1 F-type H+-transporting ATPase subunit b [Candidatus Chrysopegis kryptomonas]
MLEINPGVAIWTIITFLILVAILKKVAWKPIIDALTQREDSIRKALEDAQKAKEEAQRLMEENKRNLARAEEEVQRIIREGRETAERIRAEILEKARKEADMMIERAREEIERHREQAMLQLRAQVADLAIEVASKLIGEVLNEQKHRKLVEKYLQEISSEKRA